jgi:hypothetical protein
MAITTSISVSSSVFSRSVVVSSSRTLGEAIRESTCSVGALVSSWRRREGAELVVDTARTSDRRDVAEVRLERDEPEPRLVLCRNGILKGGLRGIVSEQGERWGVKQVAGVCAEEMRWRRSLLRKKEGTTA